jgi:3-hydroxyacyl-CoA dehydrogenase
MKKITIAGSGVLGSQIAFQTAFHGYEVSVYDIDNAALEKAKQTLQGLGKRYRADIGATQAQIDAAAGHITQTTDLAAALTDADLLIEAIPEVVAIKTEFYGKAGGLAPPKTIFATNTSTLLPSQFAKALRKRPTSSWMTDAPTIADSARSRNIRRNSSSVCCLRRTQSCPRSALATSAISSAPT